LLTDLPVFFRAELDCLSEAIYSRHPADPPVAGGQEAGEPLGGSGVFQSLVGRVACEGSIIVRGDFNKRISFKFKMRLNNCCLTDCQGIEKLRCPTK
jgi:hypothetical protein